MFYLYLIAVIIGILTNCMGYPVWKNEFIPVNIFILILCEAILAFAWHRYEQLEERIKKLESSGAAKWTLWRLPSVAVTDRPAVQEGNNE